MGEGNRNGNWLKRFSVHPNHDIMKYMTHLLL